jgi:hypothetical protein
LRIARSVILNFHNDIYFCVCNWILEALLILAGCPAFYYEITITTILTTQEEAFNNIIAVCEYSFSHLICGSSNTIARNRKQSTVLVTMMKKKSALFLSIFLEISSFLLQAEALIVSRGVLDVFSNPNRTECEINERYCKQRRARCFGNDCCKCKCEREYSTFHSPGVTYTFENGKPLYSFDGKDTCVWNHYAHEGSSKYFVSELFGIENIIHHCEIATTGSRKARLDFFPIYIENVLTNRYHHWMITFSPVFNRYKFASIKMWKPFLMKYFE